MSEIAKCAYAKLKFPNGMVLDLSYALKIILKNIQATKNFSQLHLF